jgi:hypothetical protein
MCKILAVNEFGGASELSVMALFKSYHWLLYVGCVMRAQVLVEGATAAGVLRGRFRYQGGANQ